jgi:hypothetical protein
LKKKKLLLLDSLATLEDYLKATADFKKSKKPGELVINQKKDGQIVCRWHERRAGVAMVSVKFHPGRPCPILQRPVGVCPPPTGHAACGRLLPPWTLCACVCRWRAYPFVDGFSSAPTGMFHSSVSWDQGDIVQWATKIKKTGKASKMAFRGIEDVDIKLIKPNKRSHGRMARGGHGLPKVSTGPCSTHVCPMGGTPLKRPYGCFKGGPPAGVARPQGRRPAAG